MGNVRLVAKLAFPKAWQWNTYIDLLILKSYFEVVVDSLVGDCAQQSHIGNTCGLLLCEPFTPIGLEDT